MSRWIGRGRGRETRSAAGNTSAGARQRAFMRAISLIRNGRILTLDADSADCPMGAIAIAGDRIAAIGAEADIVRRLPARRVLDAAGAQVHPGSSTAHFHVSQHSRAGCQQAAGDAGPRPVSTSPIGRPPFRTRTSTPARPWPASTSCRTGIPGSSMAAPPSTPTRSRRRRGRQVFVGGLQTRISGTVESSWTTCRASSVVPWRIEPRSIPIALCGGSAPSCAGTPIRMRWCAATWRCTGSGPRQTSSSGPPRIARIAIAWR